MSVGCLKCFCVIIYDHSQFASQPTFKDSKWSSSSFELYSRKSFIKLDMKSTSFVVQIVVCQVFFCSHRFHNHVFRNGSNPYCLSFFASFREVRGIMIHVVSETEERKDLPRTSGLLLTFFTSWGSRRQVYYFWKFQVFTFCDFIKVYL